MSDDEGSLKENLQDIGKTAAGEAFQYGEKWVELAKDFNNNSLDKALGELGENVPKPRERDVIGDLGVAKKNAGEFFHNSLLTFNYEFKVKGVSTGMAVWDTMWLGNDLVDIWSSKDESFNEKIDETQRRLYEEAGSILGAKIGKMAGEFLGSRFIPIPILGKKIGGFLGAIAGSFLGGMIGGLAYDITKYFCNKGEKNLSDTEGQFHSGGVEFIYPKEINKFKKNFCFDKCHYIAFEYEDIKNDYNATKEIIDLINSKFLVGNIKLQNLEELYYTILKEISY